MSGTRRPDIHNRDASFRQPPWVFQGRGRRLRSESPPPQASVRPVGPPSSIGLGVPVGWDFGGFQPAQPAASSAWMPPPSSRADAGDAVEVDEPRPAFFDTLIGGSAASQDLIADSQDTVPADDAQIQLETVVSEMFEVVDKLKNVKDTLELWVTVIMDHKWAAPSKASIKVLIADVDAIVNSAVPFMQNVTECRTYCESALNDIMGRFEDCKTRFTNLQDEVKPFLPRDTRLATQLAGLRSLVDPKGADAKRLRSL